ncbi:MAG: GTP pyrophosphokinase [Oscillospiraceae bacterium]|nr:GTP pyrophosphokinase [Oscillospiraceae bacterium]
MLYTALTRKAMRLAYEAHHGQLDKEGMPYIFHPARVASGFTDETGACVAWLHDVVEDTGRSIADIRAAGFPEEVCRALALLTHDKSVPYMDYVRRLSADPVAKAVKLADLRDNMDPARPSRIDAEVERRMQKYQRAYRFLIGEGD